MPSKRRHAGIEPRRSKAGEISYRAEVFDSRTGRRTYRTFPTLAAAKAWRNDTTVAIRTGQLAPDNSITVREAAEALIAGMVDGTIRARTGTVYKPATIRSYRRSIEKRVMPAFGRRKLVDIRRRDVQAFIDRMSADGFDGSTVRNTLDPLRVIFRRALVREQVAVSPMTALEVPAAHGKRERIATPEEAAKLIAALPDEDRALWATAMYAGLRRGEVRAIRWSDLDLASGVIRVERGWDDEKGEIEPKSYAARRTVPVTALLRDHLMEHRLRCEGDPDGLAFGRSASLPFVCSSVNRRADAAWAEAGLERIQLHEARHTFASICIAAGVNAKALSSYMGHATIQITFDRYGHLMPGNEAEATRQLDAYLLRSEGQSWGSEAPTTADVSGPERSDTKAPLPLGEPNPA